MNANASAKAAETFEKMAVGGKAFLILGLLALALINGNTSYVKNNPRKFMIDSIATGFFGGLAGVFLAYSRGRGDLALPHFLFGLLLFFLYNVAREFAGYFTIFGSETPTQNEAKEMKKLKWPIISIVLLGFGLACFLAYRAQVPADYSEGFLRSFRPRTALILETVLFAMIISSGEIIVTKNHGDPVVVAGLMSIFMFSVAHVMLQNGGFYEHLYGHGPPPCID